MSGDDDDQDGSSDGMTKTKLRIISRIVYYAFFVMVAMSIIMMIVNGYNSLNGMCILRYATDPTSGTLTSSSVVSSKSIALNANGNYSSITTVQSSGTMTYTPDPSGYNQWLNLGSVGNVGTNNTNTITLTITGNISLCKSYLPFYDVQNNTTPGSLGTSARAAYNMNIPIPRIEDTQTLALKFPANSMQWRNIAEVFLGDEIQVIAGPAYDSTNTTQLTNMQMPDAFTNNLTPSVSCAPTVNPVDPICGRFTPFAGNYQYANGCGPATATFPTGGCGCDERNAGICDKEDHFQWKNGTAATSSTNLGTPAYAGCYYDDGDRGGSSTSDVETVKNYLLNGIGGGSCTCGHNIGEYGCAPTGICPYPFTDTNSINAYLIANAVTWGPTKTTATFAAAPEAYNPAALYTASAIGNIFPAPESSGTVEITASNFGNYYNYYNGPQGPGAIPTCSTYNPNYTGATTRTEIGPNGIQAIVNSYYFWLINGNGLVARLDTDYVSNGGSSASWSAVPPTSQTTLGSNYTPLVPALTTPTQTDTIAASDTAAYAATPNVAAPNGSIIYTKTYASSDMTNANNMLLQFMYLDYGLPSLSSQNTGGYVLYINHTKCKRTNGQSQDDVVSARGQIQYYILPSEYNPNTTQASILSSYQSGNLDFNTTNKASITVDSSIFSDSSTANLWLIINNNPSDAADSTGSYNVQFNTNEPVGEFTSTVITPLINSAVTILNNVGSQIFAKLTCYGQDDKSACFDFFTYIKALLTLYIFVFGALFLLGKTEFNKEDILNRMIKIIFIAGLINGSTFEFMQANIIPAILNFPAQMISNFNGFAPSDPFSFLDDVLDKILLNKVTVFQLLALLSFGITGVAMFLICCMSIFLFLMAALQGICTYIFALMIVAFLLGLTPFFLVFMLFESTKSMFQKMVQ